jgi:hypothetical protein
MLQSVQATSVLAAHISGKVRTLDTAQSRVQETLSDIKSILDRTNCINGVQAAMDSQVDRKCFWYSKSQVDKTSFWYLKSQVDRICFWHLKSQVDRICFWYLKSQVDKTSFWYLKSQVDRKCFL